MANKTKTTKKTTTKKTTKVEKPVVEVKEEVKEVKKEVKEPTKKDKKLGVIITIGLIVFIVLSFLLPEPAPVETKKDSVLAWSEDIKSGMVVTVLGSSTCPHCQELKPVIQRLAEEEHFQLYFYELDTLGSDEQTILTQTIELENFAGSVPFIFVTYNGQLLGDTVGYADEESLKEFLKENEVIK